MTTHSCYHDVSQPGTLFIRGPVYPGAGIAQCWERSPPLVVSRARFPDPASYVGWVCRFSTLLREVFLRVLRFSPPLKNQHFQIPIRSWNARTLLNELWTPWCSNHFTFILLLLFSLMTAHLTQRSDTFPAWCSSANFYKLLAVQMHTCECHVWRENLPIFITIKNKQAVKWKSNNHGNHLSICIIV